MTEPRFFETIALVDGKPRHLDYHNRRYHRTMELNFGADPQFDLSDCMPAPESVGWPLARCRVDYGERIKSVACFEYAPRRLKRFKLVIADEADYSFKSADRKQLDDLYAERGKADEIIIVRDGKLTDTSIANIALLIKGSWLTPAAPLLQGTTRERLLEEKLLVRADITPDDLAKCQGFAVCNAMVGFQVISEPIFLPAEP